MPNYPNSFDDNDSLFLAVNNGRTKLSTGISLSDLTIPVLTTSGFPSTGFITILSDPDDITKAEAIRYIGVSDTTFSGVERGAGGTIASSHSGQDNVDLTVMAEHHNELKDAVIALEQFVGITGSPEFVPKDQFGNATITGTLTAQNLLDAGSLTVSGTLVVGGPGFFEGDLDVAEDLVVSGTAIFGIIPQAETFNVQYVTNENEVQITSTSYVDTGVETNVLPVGHNLVFWSASAGGGSIGSGPNINLRAIFAGATQGEAQDACLNNNNPWGGINLGGFKIITGNGVDTVKLQGDLDTSSSSAKVSAQSILSIPFGEMGLVEGTDYWYDNGSDSDTSVPALGEVITTLNATLPDAGDYIIFGSVEGENNGDFLANYWANGSQISSTQKRSEIVNDQRDFPFQLLYNLPSGANVFEVKASGAVNISRFKRGRLCVVRAASFANVVGFRQDDTQSTSSSIYSKVTSTEINYTAAQSETVIVFGNPISSVSTVTGPPMVSYKLVDETEAVDLVTDVSPARFRQTDDKIPAFLFSKLDDVFGSKTFSLSIREPEGTTSSVNHETVNMLVWGMTLADTPAITDIPITTINGNTITTHEITADGVTVSGQPVWIDAPDPLTLNDLVVTGTATITDLDAVDFNATGSATVSGVPIATDIGVRSVNLIADVITLVGAGSIATTENGQVITISGSTSGVPDPLVLASGVFSDSLTVSGVPVDITGGGGGGSGNITEINLQTGPEITITGVGNISTATVGNVITLSSTTTELVSKNFSGAVLRLEDTVFTDNTVLTTVTWSGSTYDTDGYFSGAAPTELTVPSGKGIKKVIIKCVLQIVPVAFTPAANARTTVFFSLNGTTLSDPGAIAAADVVKSSSYSTTLYIESAPIDVEEGDSFTTGIVLDGYGADPTIFRKNSYFSIEAAEVDAPFALGGFTAISGTFAESLTVSGVPVSIGEGGDISRSFSGALVMLSGANQSLPAFSTQYPEFDHVVYDTDGYYTASSGNVLTVPSGKGITHVVLKGQVRFEGSATAESIRSLNFRKDYVRIEPAAETTNSPATSAIGTVQLVSFAIPVQDGDEFAMAAFQNTAGALDMQTTVFATWFSIEDVTK